MNHKRRQRLRQALVLLSNAAAIVEDACDSEQDCVDHYPENLQGAEVFAKMEEAAECLEEAIEKMEAAKDAIERAME